MLNYYFFLFYEPSDIFRRTPLISFGWALVCFPFIFCTITLCLYDFVDYSTNLYSLRKEFSVQICSSLFKCFALNDRNFNCFCPFNLQFVGGSCECRSGSRRSGKGEKCGWVAGWKGPSWRPQPPSFTQQSSGSHFSAVVNSRRTHFYRLPPWSCGTQHSRLSNETHTKQNAPSRNERESDLAEPKDILEF